MSGSSLDGLDIAFVELDDSGSTWRYEVRASQCVEYDACWINKLTTAKLLGAFDYLALHAEYGRYIGTQVNNFIHNHHLHHQIQLIACHGHTVFHAPELGLTSQLGDGAAIAAITGINVVSDLRAMDVALGGQGAPIVPMGEKLLWREADYFLNIGGIANVSFRNDNTFIAFDVCPANRVLNMLAHLEGNIFDDGGAIAAMGTINIDLLAALNGLDYYKKPSPKALANEFGTDVVFPLVQSYKIPVSDALRTYVEHIATQVSLAAAKLANAKQINVPLQEVAAPAKKMLVTGGGAFNTFLVERLAATLRPLNITLEIPAPEIVQYKEAVVMALLGVLRWREENTVLCSVTGATRSSIGGGVWIGQEA